MRWAKKALEERIRAPEIKQSLWLTLLLHAGANRGPDVQSLPELGFFAVTSAEDGTVEVET